MGPDVIVMIKQKTMLPDVLISLRGIPGLNQIQYDGSLRIGAMVTHRALEKSELIRKEFSALADAADVLGSIQIRNVATIGGNICTAAPSADTATPLLVLGAQAKIKSLKEERMVAVEEFFTGSWGNDLKERRNRHRIGHPQTIAEYGFGLLETSKAPRLRSSYAWEYRPSSLWIKVRSLVPICSAPLPPFLPSSIAWNRMNSPAKR